MLYHFEKKKTIGKGQSLSEVAEAINKDVAKKFAANLKKSLAHAGKEWRAWAKVKLSGRCADSLGGQENHSGYPGRCSGKLERSLGYRTYTRVGKVGGKQVVSAGANASFIDFTSDAGFNYGTYHNYNPRGKFTGYQQKIYQELSKRIAKLLVPRPGLLFGGDI